ncbi:MAG TPA: [LysW]-aminoadipate kinase [Candidatus Thermoplasmatota archaeon]|nr:[LysW]-aminoadipate kinase [Candidatus Thermoplasmatota archaeon]
MPATPTHADAPVPAPQGIDGAPPAPASAGALPATAAADASSRAGRGVLVVKLGGAAGIDVQRTLADLAALAAEGQPWVLVHGGNAELDDVSRRLGHQPRFVTSPSGHQSRVTDLATVGLIQMVYRGRINNDLVLRLQGLGCNAVGLSGVDGRLWQAERKDAVRVVENGRKFLLRDDYTGRLVAVNTELLRLLLDHGYHPVLTLPALASDGSAVNVDGDRVTAQVAAALGAPDYVNLSNVPGLLRDPQDPSSLVARIERARLADFEGYAQGRFKKKLLGVREALEGGVRRVVLGDANREHPVRDALAGHGTVIA